MTPKQKNVYEFIRVYKARTGGVCPSYREIAKGCNIASMSEISDCINRLVDLGHIVKEKYKKRSLKLTESKELRFIKECGYFTQFKAWEANHDKVPNTLRTHKSHKPK